MTLQSRLAAILPALGLAACHTTGPQPAMLADNSKETRSAVSAYLREAVGRAQIEMQPEDLTGATSVSILPPPLSPMETASTARPTVFELMMDGDACFAVHNETGETVMLDGVTCVARPE